MIHILELSMKLPLEPNTGMGQPKTAGLRILLYKCLQKRLLMSGWSRWMRHSIVCCRNCSNHDDTRYQHPAAENRSRQHCPGYGTGFTMPLVRKKFIPEASGRDAQLQRGTGDKICHARQLRTDITREIVKTGSRRGKGFRLALA